MSAPRVGLPRWGVGLACLAVTLAATSPARGQSPGASKVEPAIYVAPLVPGGEATPAIQPVGCASCDGGLLPATPSAPGLFGAGRRGGSCGPAGCDLGCASPGCGEGGCVAGRQPCETCDGGGPASKLLCAFHNALCCPDPCYEPRWRLGANAALFVAGARPVTQTAFRWDSGKRLTTPDRAEYFWASIGRKGPGRPEPRVNYNELTLTVETASDRFSFFVNTPYRAVNGDANGGAGSFADLSLGTKTLFLDSELLQMAFQFTTFVPTGVASRGTGVGHVSLEPALVTALKLYPETYLQSEIAYWIPISATDGASGGVLRYNHSLNHTLYQPTADMKLVGTFEMQGWTFTAGTFTDPVTGQRLSANNTTYITIGPGFRFGICDKLDVGFGMQFAVTKDHFAEQLYRTELRWRF